jgi:predicted phage terminase large subunit-like protein
MKLLRRYRRVQALRRFKLELAETRATPPPRQSCTSDARPLHELPLVEFIPRLKPGARAPLHLKPLNEELDACIAPHEGQRFYWFSVPPRHWKTTTLKNALAKHLLRWPDESVAYCSHTQPFANKQSREIRKLILKAGVNLSNETNRQDEWELAGREGGLVARGVGGDLTGRGFRLIIVDDPVKSAAKAYSATEREALWEWLQNDVITRLAPDGCLILVHTRWHPDDPIGRARKAANDNDGQDDPTDEPIEWRGCNLQALRFDEDAGEEVALLPDQWPATKLRPIRKANPRRFAALYQGEPILKGAAVFADPSFYDDDELPGQGYRVGYGVDLAYSEATAARADYSVIIRVYAVPTKDEEGKPCFKLYVVDVVRKQVDAPSFLLTLRARHSEIPGKMLWIASGTEKGTAQFIRRRVPLRIKTASQDKYQRALPVAEAWNLGRVLVPKKAKWLAEFLDEITTFTGVKDAHDDQVDALAAAFALFTVNPMIAALSGKT